MVSVLIKVPRRDFLGGPVGLIKYMESHIQILWIYTERTGATTKYNKKTLQSKVSSLVFIVRVNIPQGL